MLTTAQRPPRSNCHYQIRPTLTDGASRQTTRLARKLSWAKCLFGNFRSLREEIKNGGYNRVLLESYSEYLAPFWAGQFRSLARAGVKFGAIVHDPVRDYMVGPPWWHRRSIAAAYSFLREAFVHEEIRLDTVRPMPALHTTVIPHGPYQFPKAGESRGQMRKKWSIPEDAFVLLSFGHIRDGKNLDLAIQALRGLPRVFLVVAGKEQSSAQKPVSYYQELAQSLGVQQQCRWSHGHVPESEVGNLFAAADLVLLTYGKDFRSASGVLNAAANYRRPCLASSGSGNLRSVVERYSLGWFIEPDNSFAVKAGIETAMHEQLNPRWDAYESDNSWRLNAQLVKNRMFE